MGLPQNTPDNLKFIEESIAENRKRERSRFLWWLVPNFVLALVISIGTGILIRWVWNDISRRERIQCLDYNGPLLNACLQNCSLSPQMSHAQCEDFCEKTACKKWTQ